MLHSSTRIIRQKFRSVILLPRWRWRLRPRPNGGISIIRPLPATSRRRKRCLGTAQSSESSGAAASSRYRLVPIPYGDALTPRMPQLFDDASPSVGATAAPPSSVRKVPPPSYEMAQSFKMAALATPPANRRLTADDIVLPAQFFSGAGTATPSTLLTYTNIPNGGTTAALNLALHNASVLTPQQQQQQVLHNGHREGHREMVAKTNGYVNVPDIFSQQPASLPVVPSADQAPAMTSVSEVLYIGIFHNDLWKIKIIFLAIL